MFTHSGAASPSSADAVHQSLFRASQRSQGGRRVMQHKILQDFKEVGGHQVSRYANTPRYDTFHLVQPAAGTSQYMADETRRAHMKQPAYFTSRPWSGQTADKVRVREGNMARANNCRENEVRNQKYSERQMALEKSALTARVHARRQHQQRYNQNMTTREDYLNDMETKKISLSGPRNFRSTMRSFEDRGNPLEWGSWAQRKHREVAR